MSVFTALTFLASTSDDGLASWRQFVHGFEAHLTGQRSLLPVVGVIAGLLALTWLNVWLVRRLLRNDSSSQQRRRGQSSRP